MINEEILKEFFEAEDEILQKAMDKITYLMVSRNINQNEERGKLLVLREKLLKKV